MASEFRRDPIPTFTGLDYSRSNHRERKDYKIARQEEVIVSRVRTDPDLHLAISKLVWFIENGQNTIEFQEVTDASRIE